MDLSALKAEILTGPLAAELATLVAKGNHRAARLNIGSGLSAFISLLMGGQHARA